MPRCVETPRQSQTRFKRPARDQNTRATANTCLLSVLPPLMAPGRERGAQYDQSKPETSNTIWRYTHILNSRCHSELLPGSALWACSLGMGSLEIKFIWRSNSRVTIFTCPARHGSLVQRQLRPRRHLTATPAMAYPCKRHFRTVFMRRCSQPRPQ